MRERVKAMSASTENWMTASMRLETAASAAKVKSVCGAKSQRANAAPPKVSCPEIKVVDAIAGEGARATLAPISSAMAKMPGLLGTTRRLWGESQRNQRDHCRRRGSTGRSKPCRASESVTRRVKDSIQGSSSRGRSPNLFCDLSQCCRQTDCSFLVVRPGGSGNGHRSSSNSQLRTSGSGRPEPGSLLVNCFVKFTGCRRVTSGLVPFRPDHSVFYYHLPNGRPVPAGRFQSHGIANLLPLIVPVKR